MDFDVLLQTHNNLRLTIGCIEALYKNTHLDFRLIVVDDSTDLTPEYMERLKKEHTNLEYIRPAKPFKSPAEVFAAGLECCKTDYIIFLTNSVTVEPNWLDIAFPLMKVNKNVGVMGIKLLYPTGMIECAGAIVANGKIGNIGLQEAGHRHTYISQVDAIGGAVMLFRRDSLKDWSFDQRYVPWGGFEDIDICLQLRKSGREVVYCGHGAAYHYTGATRGLNPDYWKNFAQNEQVFMSKWKELVFRDARIITPKIGGGN